MRIALLTEGIYPDKIGGIQKHTFLMAQELAREGVYVDIYSHTFNAYSAKDHFEPEALSYINIHTVPFQKGRIYFPGHFLYESWSRSKELCELLRASSDHYNFVYIQGFSGLAYLGNQLSKTISVVNFHGLEMYQIAASVQMKMQHLLFRPFVDYCLTRAHYNVSLGGKLTSILSQRVEEKKILETPIGVDKSWIGPEGIGTTVNRKRRLVFLGRFERRKGVEELHQVLQQVSDDYDFQMIFIGPIPESERLPMDHVQYLGLIRDQHAIQNTLQSADVLVCPSWSEGMPTVILEAMASGCAIIATDVGATADIVSGQNGWLIPPGDVISLQNAMIEALTISDERLIHKKKNSLTLVKEKFTWDKIVKLFVNQLSDITQ